MMPNLMGVYRREEKTHYSKKLADSETDAA
jgi:hypothetical protein